MPEWVTRITTSPAARSSRLSISKRAAIWPPSVWMRKALKRLIPSTPGACALALEPRDESLRVESQVSGERLCQLCNGQGAALAPRQAQPQGEHIRANAARRVGIVGVCARDACQLRNLLLEERGETRHPGHAAEVHQVHRFGPIGEHPVDGGNMLCGVELRRHGRGHDERALLGVE